MQAAPTTKSLFTIPDWVTGHPVLKSRGIILEIVLKPYIAWRSPYEPDDVPPYVVKIVKEGSEEADIYTRLLQYDRASPNHSVPCDVVRTESQRPLLVMPSIDGFQEQAFSRWTVSQLLDCLYQLVEGLEFLHDRHIAHFDLRPDNLLYAREWDVRYHKEIELGKLYIIDFSESRQLSLGPGQQPPIDLPQSIIPKPLDMQRLDPYAFDVYCLGMVIDMSLALVYKSRPKPWLLQRYAQWLIGTERGCTGVCHCRPTARRARQVFAFLHWVVRGWSLWESIMHMLSLCVSDLLSDYIMLHKYISQVSLVQCSLWQWAIRGVILLQKWYVLGLQYPLTARAPGYQTPLSGIPCFYITQTHVKRKRLTWMVLSQRILR